MRADETFTILIRPQLPGLYRLSYRLTGTVPDAEDLLQELLIKVYQRRDEVLRIESLRAWLTRVLYTLFIDMKRHQGRSPLYLAVDNSEDAIDPVDSLTNEHVNEPEAALILDAEQQRLVSAMDQLGEDHRVVIILADIEGYSFKEMEDILDCPQGTLKSRLHRARARLREILE
jgi:RNA polymerase sigma factor (sigma-70 family)